ncbi:MAG: hypothetical protein Q7S65_02660 [Nanoarchaeota archaeon]|nr:hypothetical protein [Nanoarchaeota archaeon]
MKIHGLVYLIVGGFILGFSYFMTEIKHTVETEKFYLFYAFGALFCLIALGKFLVRVIAKMREPKLEPLERHIQQPSHPHHQAHAHHKSQAIPHHAQHQQSATLPSQQAPPTPAPHNPNLKYCGQCGAPMRAFDRFCYRCGNQSSR